MLFILVYCYAATEVPIIPLFSEISEGETFHLKVPNKVLNANVFIYSYRSHIPLIFITLGTSRLSSVDVKLFFNLTVGRSGDETGFSGFSIAK